MPAGGHRRQEFRYSAVVADRLRRFASPFVPSRASSLIASMALALGSASVAQAVEVRLSVGDDDACDFRTSEHSNALQAAVDAWAAAPGAGVVIALARSGMHDGVRIAIDHGGRVGSLAVRGGYPTCAAMNSDGEPTLLDGGEASAGAVIEIGQTGTVRGPRVELVDLAVTGAAGGPGLRIHAGEVDLVRVQLLGNSTAASGGGVEVLGPGARLRTSGGRIADNSAGGDGGGISCRAGAALEIASDTAITGNHAQGSGGGVHADGCSGRIDSGAVGWPDSPAMLGDNSAGANGGGLSAASGLGPTELVLGSSSGGNSSSVVISGNSAGDSGGGVHATGAQTRLLLRNTRVVSNVASHDGGALAAADGATIELRAAQRRCPHGEICARVSGNSAAHGGALAVSGGALIELEGVDVFDNSALAASVATMSNAPAEPWSRMYIRNSFLHRNTGSTHLIEITSSHAELQLLQATVSGDASVAAIAALGQGSSLLLGRTIVTAPATTAVVVAESSASIEVDCSLLHESVSLGAALDLQSVIFDDPGFVDAAAGDFRLRSDAESTDRCDFDARYPSWDFQLEPRPQRAALPKAFGPYDIGADEWSATLFRDGLEG
jgi:predicted outer membrane repeat protein